MPMDLQLSGTVAVVAGAARGLGRAIAGAFVAEGAQVALLDVVPEVQNAAEQLARAGATAERWITDVTDYTAIVRVAGEIRSRFGTVDHVVFAVGVGSGKFGMPFWN